jgi:hypothetical protein
VRSQPTAAKTKIVIQRRCLRNSNAPRFLSRNFEISTEINRFNRLPGPSNADIFQKNYLILYRECLALRFFVAQAMRAFPAVFFLPETSSCEALAESFLAIGGARPIS